MDTQRLWERLYWSDSHWLGRSGIAHMAIGAVDIALWISEVQAFGPAALQACGRA